MKKTIPVLVIAFILIIAISISMLFLRNKNEVSVNRYKEMCKADDAVVAIMDIKTKQFTKIDSTFPETSPLSKEIQKQMRKNIEFTTKIRAYEFGPILRPFVLGYLEKNNPQFTPTMNYLTINDYRKFGDMVIKYLPPQDIFKPFISFGLFRYQFKKPLTENELGNQNSYYYSAITNGYSEFVSIDELMKAYSKLFSDPAYTKTKNLLLQNFAPKNKNIGGVEYSYWMVLKNKNSLVKRGVSKSLIMYINNGDRQKVAAIILTNIKNRDCRKHNYLYKHFAKELIDVVKD